jgi:hypothetical protein
MNASTSSIFAPRHLQRATWLVALVWTLAVAASVVWSTRLLHDAMLKAAERDAQNSYNKDVLYRRWAAAHGAVFTLELPLPDAGELT